MSYYKKVTDLYTYSKNNKFTPLEKKVDSDDYEYLRLLYVKDLWMTEVMTTIPEDNIEEILIDYIEGKETSLTHIEKQIINNLFETFDKYSNNNYELNIELIKSIHISLMKNLINGEYVGIFREKNVCPKNSNMEYMSYNVINEKLEELIQFYNNTHCDNINEKIIKTIIFFSEFLRIHPFIDGNGRTARILFNYLISDITNYPISLCKFSYRDEYIDMLERRSYSLEYNNDLSYLIKYIQKIIMTL